MKKISRNILVKGGQCRMKCYIYCTKTKPYLLKIKSEDVGFMCNYKQWLIDNNNLYQEMAYNGKIVAECEIEVEIIDYELYEDLDWQHEYLPTTDTMNIINLERFSCLDREELDNYLQGKAGYAWHINNLRILDKPIELNKFNKPISEKWIYYGCEKFEKAPQSWCYANYNNELCIIISIKPEWVCKILNREKTVEVRKNAPKGLKN